MVDAFYRRDPMYEDDLMEGVRFVRRVDGLTHEFVRDGEAHGYPSFKRVDRDVWCRRLPDFGWVVCNQAGAVSSRPFADPGLGGLPPQGVWVSFKGDASYVYDLAQTDAEVPTESP